MSWYQCSTCGELFASAGDLAAHKREAHLSHARTAGRKVVAAALLLTAAIGLADCDEGPGPAWANEVRP